MTSSSSSCGGGGSGGTACTIIHHVMILVHGIMGNSKELGYVQYALQRDFDTAIQQQRFESDNSLNSVVFPKLLVHSATCNEEDSLDGIEAGGLRLAEEINNLLRDYVEEEMSSPTKEDYSRKDDVSSQHVIALSFLGFSLGGMYSRYSLPFIDWNIKTPNNSNVSIAVIPNVFVTTATPHLGIQQMTYWKLPTCLEPIVAWYLGQTGRDLFRRPNNRQQQQSAIDNSIVDSIIYKDVIQQMSLDSKFLLPLSKFQKRIAVANAFSTDFAVHTATAAFLTDDDVNDETVLGTMNDDGTDIEQCHSSAHFVVGENNSHDNEEQEEEAIHGMTTRTETRDKTVHFPTVRFATSRSWSHSDVGHESFSSEISQERYSSCDTDGPSDHDPPQHSERICQRPLLHRPTDGSLSDMANSLNSLGWTKVFVDVRSHIPALWSRPKATIKEITVATHQDQSTSQPTTSTSQFSSSKVFSPSALKRRLSGKGFDFNTLPFGHSFLVASTKNWWYTWFYKDGRNFVDRFSQELVIECLGMNLDDINNN